MVGGCQPNVGLFVTRVLFSELAKAGLPVAYISSSDQALGPLSPCVQFNVGISVGMDGGVYVIVGVLVGVYVIVGVLVGVCVIVGVDEGV
jgi:hypothetical protein